MKKVYSKPEIMFEDFTVTAAISAGCEEIVNSAENICALVKDYGDWIVSIFNVGVVAQCEVGPDKFFNGLCYHIPDGYNTFTS